MELYQKKQRLFKNVFVVFMTTVPAFNLTLIFIEIFKYNRMSKAAAIYILLSVFSQTINFLVVGPLVIRKLYVYFQTKYDLQRRSLIKALCLIMTALVLMNIRYALQVID